MTEERGGTGPAQPAARPDFGRFFEHYAVGPELTLEERQEEKLRLVREIGRADSIRDYGGLWGVHGLYLLEGAKALRCRRAEMVDYEPFPEFDENVKRLQAEWPVEVEMIKASFQRPSLYDTLGPVDVALLYDVLLHQDNVDVVIKKVAENTSKVVCVAQPVMVEALFSLPNGCVNLQFYPEELKDILRCPGLWPPEPPTTTFTTTFWMWGQTVSFLTSMFGGYGWDRTVLRVHRVSSYWHYALMRFAPREGKTR